LTPFHTSSPAETRAFGATLAEVLEPGDIVLLAGELGAGKTTLVQGIGDRFGVSEPMTSPTFTLMRTYDTSPAIAHVDIWRVEHLHEVLDLGLEEVLEDGGIALVEWGDVILPHLGRDAILVRLSRVPADAGDAGGPDVADGAAGRGGASGEDEREITVQAVSTAPTSSAEARVAKLTAVMRVAG
jgi:tRNA threonylcarbamoyladenosine biosynthesis protein TsaE